MQFSFKMFLTCAGPNKLVVYCTNRNISQQDLYTMIFNSDLEPHTVRRPTNWFFLQNSCYAVCPLMNSIMSFVASNQRIVTAKMTTVAPPPHCAAVRRAARRGQMAPSSGFKYLKSAKNRFIPGDFTENSIFT